MSYTVDLLNIITELFEKLNSAADEYEMTLDELFSDVITLGSEIVEWEVTNIENKKEK